MKVRKLVMTMFPLCALLTAGLTACEDKNEGEAEVKKDEAATASAETAKPAEAAKPTEVAKPAEPPPAPKEPPAPPPAEICSAVAGAVKAKDEAKLLTLSTPSTVGALSAEGAKEHIMSQLANVVCGAAKVEGDNATVAVAGGEMPQDVPFVKVSDAWKFDAAGYLSKYPPPAHRKDKAKEHHGKGGKAHAAGKKHGKK